MSKRIPIEDRPPAAAWFIDYQTSWRYRLKRLCHDGAFTLTAALLIFPALALLLTGIFKVFG